MTFQDEQRFFRQLGPNKPNWLSMTQWKVLQRYYSYENPDTKKVLNDMAVQLMGVVIKTQKAGYGAAEEALRVGKQRIQERMDLQDMDFQLEIAKPASSHQQATRHYWWMDRD